MKVITIKKGYKHYGEKPTRFYVGKVDEYRSSTARSICWCTNFKMTKTKKKEENHYF